MIDFKLLLPFRLGVQLMYWLFSMLSAIYNILPFMQHVTKSQCTLLERLLGGRRRASDTHLSMAQKIPQAISIKYFK